MVHSRKAQLVQLAFERDLSKKLSGEWKDKVLQKFSATTRRLQLFQKSNGNVIKLSFSVSVRMVSFRQTLRSNDSLSTISSNKRRLPVENEKSLINKTFLMWKGRTWWSYPVPPHFSSCAPSHYFSGAGPVSEVGSNLTNPKNYQ